MFAQLRKQTEQIWAKRAFESKPAEHIPNFLDGDREFFRIDTTIGLRYWSFLADGHINSAERCHVNLSGGGMRFALDKELRTGDKIWLEIILPDAQASIITCIGRVVRRFRDHSGQFEAAFQFVNIATRDQDRIISYCLSEQSKRLREKVRVCC
ncbi:MAG: PilZ domain-containing protein [Desulfuromonadaceae bacterium]|jgi:c-di-GMP-binding flagellar brake protein YcgR